MAQRYVIGGTLNSARGARLVAPAFRCPPDPSHNSLAGPQTRPEGRSNVAAARRRAPRHEGGREERRKRRHSAGLMSAALITAAQRAVSSLTTLAACSSVVCCGVVLILRSRSCTSGIFSTSTIAALSLATIAGGVFG